MNEKIPESPPPPDPSTNPGVQFKSDASLEIAIAATAFAGVFVLIWFS